MHYGWNRLMPIGWSLVEDARGHPAYPEVRVPTLVTHGRRDEVVECECSERFAAAHPGVEFERVDSDHTLGDVVPWILQRTFRFVALWFPGLA
jgi:hypothetical protein